MRYLLLTLCLLAVGCVSTAGGADGAATASAFATLPAGHQLASPIPFLTDEAAARDLAKEQGKPLLVFYAATW